MDTSASAQTRRKNMDNFPGRGSSKTEDSELFFVLSGSELHIVSV